MSVSNPFEDVINLLKKIEQKVDATLERMEALEQEQQHNTAPDAGQLLTKKEAAKLLACSPQTIDRYRSEGKLNAQYIGKAVRFRRVDVLNITTERSEFSEMMSLLHRKRKGKKKAQQKPRRGVK